MLPTALATLPPLPRPANDLRPPLRFSAPMRAALVALGYLPGWAVEFDCDEDGDEYCVISDAAGEVAGIAHISATVDGAAFSGHDLKRLGAATTPDALTASLRSYLRRTNPVAVKRRRERAWVRAMVDMGVVDQARAKAVVAQRGLNEA